MMATAARKTLPADPTSAGLARMWLTANFSADLREDVLYNAALMASELVTNALRHTRSAQDGVEVTGEVDAGTFTLEVIDGGSAISRPQLSDAHYDAETGRGLHIIDALADEWGVRDLVDGRRAVWVTVKL